MSTQTLHDELEGSGTHTLSFRPGALGTIAIDAHIVDPVRQPPGEPLYDVSLMLYRPGDTTPVARDTPRPGKTAAAIHYAITAADLARAGAWTLRIANTSGAPGTLATTVTFPTGLAIRTVSFDLDLLNLLFVQVLRVAQPRVHLQTGSQTSYVAWSAAAAALIGAPSHAFDLPTFPASWHGVPLSYRIVSLDTSAITAQVTYAAPLTIRVGIAFETSGVELQGADHTTPDVDLRELSAIVDVGFDGSVTAQFTVSARSVDGGIDVSETISTSLKERAQGLAAPATIRGFLELFLKGLLRLDASATITGYDVAGRALIVSYTELPTPIIAIPRPHPIQRL